MRRLCALDRARGGVGADDCGRVQKHRHHAHSGVGDDQIGPAVAIQVRDRNPKGKVPGAEGLPGGEAECGGAVGVVFSSTDTVLELMLVTTRSGRPSPFKSAATTDSQFPTAKVC